MKCYIETKRIPGEHGHDDEGFARIISEQDYLYGGPLSESYRTPRMPCVSLAREAAEELAGDMLLQVVPREEITG